MRCCARRPMAAFLSFLLALYFLRAPLAPASSVVGALPETHSFFSTCASGETRRRVAAERGVVEEAADHGRGGRSPDPQ